MSSLLLLDTDEDRFLGRRSLNLGTVVLLTLSRLRPLEWERFRGRLLLCLTSLGDRLLLLLRDLPIVGGTKLRLSSISVLGIDEKYTRRRKARK